jgi:hypothetical protein
MPFWWFSCAPFRWYLCIIVNKINNIFLFMKLLRLFGCLIKQLTYFKGKPIKNNSMSIKRRCEMVDYLKNFMWAKLAMVRLFLPKLEFQHDLHGRYFRYQWNIFNTTEIRRSWHVDKLLNCMLVYSNETKDDLRLESQIFANSWVIKPHIKYNSPILFVGLPTSCKRYGNGVSIVAVKVRFYITTVISSEGGGKQSISCESLNRSNRRDLNKRNDTNIYDTLLNPGLITESSVFSLLSRENLVHKKLHTEISNLRPLFLSLWRYKPFS